jgi:hypothetical protein
LRGISADQPWHDGYCREKHEPTGEEKEGTGELVGVRKGEDQGYAGYLDYLFEDDERKDELKAHDS